VLLLLDAVTVAVRWTTETAGVWGVTAWFAAAAAFAAQEARTRRLREVELRAAVENLVRREMGLPPDPRFPPAPPPGSAIYRGRGRWR
jgi:hypothetical protein